MAVVIAAELGKDIGGEPLFDDVAFKLERGERLTLSGRNGSGKTTLLRMLAGESHVDRGSLVFEKGARVALHDQRPPRERELNLRDYILEGAADLVAIEKELERLEHTMAAGTSDAATLATYAQAQARLEHAGGYDWRERALAGVVGVGFRGEELDRPLRSFSGGELTRASLARALAGDPDLLLLDEPTNHLDIASLEWLEARLTSSEAAIVLVAHDRWFLEAVGTAVLELDAGRGRYFNGPWHAWRMEKAARERAAGRQAARQEAEIARLERFVERFRAGTRARQAQSRRKRLERIERGGRPARDGRTAGFTFEPPARSGRVVLELEGGRVEIGGRTLLDDFDLWLERGEHVLLVGPNGAGKTTLLEALTGERPLARGKLRRGHNTTVGYLSQHAEEVGNEGTVLEATQRATGLTPNKAHALLGRFLFGGDEADKAVARLSGGERRRLALALLVQSGANFLVLDEPTNHLDIESREALEDALQAFQGSLLLVSHDRALLAAVGTRTVAVEDGTLRSYAGGWADYLRVRAAREAAGGGAGGRAPERPLRKAAPGDDASTRTAARAARKTPREGSKRGREVRRVAALEREIEAAEAALAALEDELSEPSAWAGGERSRDSARRHEDARRRVERLYEELEAAVPG